MGRSEDGVFQEEVVASAKALRQRRDGHIRKRIRRTAYWSLGGRQCVSEMRSWREVRKALKTP